MTRFGFLSVLALSGLCVPAWAQQPATIALPDMLAIEMPRGLTAIGPSESPLKELLSSGRSGSRLVTTNLKSSVGAGPVRVTWSAWDGAPGAGKPAATRTARIFILPNGMTPVGVSGDENATAGNNSVHIARDPSGRVHMVWQDGGREGGRTGPVYRRAAVAADGRVTFETGPIYIAEGSASDWNGYPSLAINGNSVQLVWQGANMAHTRRLTPGPGGWTMGPILNTGAKSSGRDVGPAITADERGGLHIVTPSGDYATSTDGGFFWKSEAIPLPGEASMKTSSVTADRSGTVHIAFSAPTTRKEPPGRKLGQYWQLRTISRTADGKWINASNVLAGLPSWADANNSDDVVADWPRIAADVQGGLHITWHGTALTREFAHDNTFYAYKPPAGDWQRPLLLVPQEPARGISFSYSPSLTLDDTRAFALSFYDIYAGPKWLGFDSRLAVLRNGVAERPSLGVTAFASAARAAGRPQYAMGSRFPQGSPALFRERGGRATLDILSLYQSSLEPAGPSLVVYHRLDVTDRAHGP